MSTPIAPDPAAHYRTTHKEALSKVAGVGAGSAILVWASALGLSPGATRIIELAAPTIAVVISTCGPYFTRFMKSQFRYHGLHYLLKRSKKFAASINPDSPSRIEADQTVRNLELVINDLNNDSAGFVNSLWR